MHSFKELSDQFEKRFNGRHFPLQPASLYDAAQYILQLGGKRIRPILCLMGNELFDDIREDAFEVATAVELFHNFSLIHDDIMDKAPLRRGKPTVHYQFNESTALLAGDVMLVQVYEYLNKVDKNLLPRIIHIFNKSAREVCEGQQVDMEFENMLPETISMDNYLHMITHKTSVLLAASLQMGAVIGGAGEGNANHLYAFGKNVGIAFQIQDDYLDAFGDPDKFGKKAGGDILSNKKTFLLLKAYELCDHAKRQELQQLINSNEEDKVKRVINIFKHCGIDEWATQEKARFSAIALTHLEAIAVLSARKKPLEELADFLLNRQH
jgi:geranylgeranyl diphosphate synthase, type II